MNSQEFTEITQTRMYFHKLSENFFALCLLSTFLIFLLCVTCYGCSWKQIIDDPKYLPVSEAQLPFCHHAGCEALNRDDTIIIVLGVSKTRVWGHLQCCKDITCFYFFLFTVNECICISVLLWSYVFILLNVYVNVCVWYMYVNVIKLFVGGNGIFGLVLPWECTSYLRKTPNTFILISVRKTEQ